MSVKSARGEDGAGRARAGRRTRMDPQRGYLVLLAVFAIVLAALWAGRGEVDGGVAPGTITSEEVGAGEVKPIGAALGSGASERPGRSESAAPSKSGETKPRTVPPAPPESAVGVLAAGDRSLTRSERPPKAAAQAATRGSKMTLSGEPVRRPTDGRPVLLTAMGDTIPYAPMGKTIGRSPLEDSPGYQRVVDPESTAVVTGRRQVAVHDRSLGEGARSAEDLALWILDALAAADREQLKALLITPEEFREILWPEFPESRPITRLEARDAWFFLERTSLAGINQALNLVGGTPLELERITYEVGFAPYTNFALYHGARIHARRPGGEPIVLDFADSFVECRGVWRVYTYKD